MKYEVDISIDLPRERVIELFNNQENLSKWMPTLKSFNHKSGEPGEEGAKSTMVFTMRGKDTEMTETIVKQNFPEEFHCTYETTGVWNLQENYFTEPDKDSTHWRSVCEFKGTNFMMKAMLFLMPGMFKKESCRYLERFKSFAEAAS